MNQTIAIVRVEHIGIRVRNLDRALNFYRVVGFNLLRRAEGDDVAIIRNENGVGLNLVFNANAGDPTANVLMDAPDKIPRGHEERFPPPGPSGRCGFEKRAPAHVVLLIRL